jgi:UDP-3-O-[3-hydroxymyristoyl] glucosamine N-acyltransferase
VGDGVTIGEDCLIGPHVVIYRQTHIGDRVRIHGGSVIGGDGFGYVFHEGRHVKVPQVGNVVIEDDVEIGCNVCIDRATIGSTLIKRGTKIDNLVQIGHNNRIGQHVIITGQGGFSGSVTVGDYAVFGGRAGITDHVTIGERAQVGLCSVVTKSVAPGETVWGYPARSSSSTKHQLAALARLPTFLKRITTLFARVVLIEKQLTRLEERGQKLRLTEQPT